MPRGTYPVAGPAKLLAPGAARRRDLRIHRQKIRQQHGASVEATEARRRRQRGPHLSEFELKSGVQGGAALLGRVCAV